VSEPYTPTPAEIEAAKAEIRAANLAAKRADGGPVWTDRSPRVYREPHFQPRPQRD